MGREEDEVTLGWSPQFSAYVKKLLSVRTLANRIRMSLLGPSVDGEGQVGHSVITTQKQLGPELAKYQAVQIARNYAPLAPWESPGDAKMFIEAKAGESLSVLTNWQTVSAIVVATAGGAIALASIVSSGGSGTRIQVGNVYFSSSSGANTTQVEFKEETSGNVAAAFTRVSSGGWCGYLLADDKDLQIEASGLTASCTNSYMLQYRVLTA